MKIILLTCAWLCFLVIIAIILDKLYHKITAKSCTNCYYNYCYKGCPYWHKCYRYGKPNFRER